MKGSEYLYWLFDALPKQATCGMRTLRVKVYTEQWFYGEQGSKFMSSLTFLM